jgi:hypothetical protein
MVYWISRRAGWGAGVEMCCNIRDFYFWRRGTSGTLRRVVRFGEFFLSSGEGYELDVCM